MFFACAGLILASLEQILPDLYDNAILLGVLSVAVGLLYLIDMADPLSRKMPMTTQTETQISTISHPTMMNMPIKLHKDAQTATDSYPPTPQMNREPSMGRGSGSADTVDFVEVKQYPEKQSPKFASVRESRLIPGGNKMALKEYPEPWEEFEPSVVFKPPSIRSLRGATQSPDYGYQSATYVAAPPVDRGNLVIKKARPMMYHYYPDYSTTSPTSDHSLSEIHHHHHQQQQPHHQLHQDNHQPIKRGYVANAARLWDSRVSGKSSTTNNKPSPLNTNV